MTISSGQSTAASAQRFIFRSLLRRTASHLPYFLAQGPWVAAAVWHQAQAGAGPQIVQGRPVHMAGRFLPHVPAGLIHAGCMATSMRGRNCIHGIDPRTHGCLVRTSSASGCSATTGRGQTFSWTCSRHRATLRCSVGALRPAVPRVIRISLPQYTLYNQSQNKLNLDLSHASHALLVTCRMAVAFVFPMFMFSVVIIRSVILFKRGAIRDKEERLLRLVARRVGRSHPPNSPAMLCPSIFKS